ncbi:hypothetical protein SB48_HM08orf00090 [Heyndrickxia coagulans]|uniref:Uncharacterized protein n=1 Tax=Heyndrickxia coagulans TaxID=1398 RepID=A0AAN0T1N6_HEYCO|nr:hypothetical protein SB48_HM08orf00090 [Heyndrickxia coagulans]
MFKSPKVLLTGMLLFVFVLVNVHSIKGKATWLFLYFLFTQFYGLNL